MTKENEQQLKVKDFEVEPILVDHPPIHKRHAFSFTVEGDEFKGHFHDGEIQWMHPEPKQMIGEEKADAIENKIHELLRQYGISNPIKDIEIEQVFEGKPHERHQFILKVDGEEFKGFVHEGEIQWFQPHPKQKLKDEHVEAIETEIHEKVEGPYFH
ncbi:hypothetical protein [Peribacillus loiseleuriae]|uniref:HicA family toxin-antitoxin system n=1 Tax=Peribacillus loiseleuriae TaxID=1679170 RepID=A0A0K9GPG6_9BACI|nr:hypothetical protein [Peribacillus loiseleuriae]KMY48538.1 hypothetical protein AC625_02600 [Peribacillus loiseleuriae]